MRPVAVTEGIPNRSRKSSLADQLPASISDQRPAGPTTYFLAHEDDINDEDTQLTEEQKVANSSFGVHSLEETIAGSDSVGKIDDVETVPDEVCGESSSPPSHRRSTIRPVDRHEEPLLPPSKHNPKGSGGNNKPSPQMPIPVSQPLTPLFLNSPADASSLPSSPKSMSTRMLDEESALDDTGSQAITSGDDGEEGEVEMTPEVQDSAPQLIMPSIKMPSRRPFTLRGKNMGRFKVLVAGESGTGKTSLIKSIVQLCEDIVHVDPLSPAFPRIEVPRRFNKSPRGKSNPKEVNGTKAITEIYASTKPYPSWWSDFEESHILRRRKSMGDSVLERNLCFVDCPGCGCQRGSDTLDTIVRYMEGQLQRSASAVGSGGEDLVNLLSGNGGWQVDALFYLISEDTLSSDIQHIKRLSELTNVIPVISKSDLLSTTQIQSLRDAIYQKALYTGAHWCVLGQANDKGTSTSHLDHDIFAVSSANSDDPDNMDASLLMSPDYVQPLISSELGQLVRRVFEQETISRLRYSTAKKLVQWHSKNPSSRYLGTPLSMRSPSPYTRDGVSGFASPLSSPSNSQVLVSYTADNSTYTLARVADYTQREEKIAQLRLANWAADLQRSLQNERERYEALARGERAVWLTERLGECVVDGSLVPITQTPGVDIEVADRRGAKALVRPGQRYAVYRGATTIDRNDPLGLIRWNESMHRMGWATIQIVGSFGIVGGIAVWLTKNWGYGGQILQEWRLDWEGWGWGWPHGR